MGAVAVAVNQHKNCAAATDRDRSEIDCTFEALVLDEAVFRLSYWASNRNRYTEIEFRDEPIEKKGDCLTLTVTLHNRGDTEWHLSALEQFGLNLRIIRHSEGFRSQVVHSHQLTRSVKLLFQGLTVGMIQMANASSSIDNLY